MLITRPQLPLTGPIDREDLQALNDIGVALEDADITDIVEAVEDTLGTGVTGRNYFVNPDLNRWSAGAGPVYCPVDVWTELADEWKARTDSISHEVHDDPSPGSDPPPSSTPTMERVSDTAHQDWLYAVKIKGNTGVGIFDFGQQIVARIAATLHPNVTVTFEIKNETGAAFIPTLRLDTCTSTDNFSSTTNRVDETLDSIANNERKTYTVTLNVNSWGSAMKNGCVIYLRIPDNTLTADTKSFTFYAAKAEKGESATTRVIERDLSPEASGDASTAGEERELIRNGNFTRWLIATSACAEDVDTYVAESWAVLPSDGNTLTAGRQEAAPNTGSLFCLELTGATAVTGTVDIAQSIAAKEASSMRRDVVFSAWIYNYSGAAVAPEFRVYTADALDDFTATTLRVQTTLATCANNTWTQVQATWDGASYADTVNGVRLAVRFPAGTLNSGAKAVRIAQARLQPGQAASTWNPPTDLDAPAVLGGARGFQVTKASNTTLTVQADEAVLHDAAGRVTMVRGLSVTVDIATNGVNGLDTGSAASSTWYHIWVVSDGRNGGAMISLSDSAPTLDGAYVFRERLGAVRLNGSTQVPAMKQRQGLVIVAPAAAFNSTVTAGGTYQEIDLANYIPNTAIGVRGTIGVSTTNEARVALAAEDSPLCGEQTFIFTQGTGTFNNYRGGIGFHLPVYNAQKLNIKADTTAPTYRLEVTGYDLW